MPRPMPRFLAQRQWLHILVIRHRLDRKRSPILALPRYSPKPMGVFRFRREREFNSLADPHRGCYSYPVAPGCRAWDVGQIMTKAKKLSRFRIAVLRGLA